MISMKVLHRIDATQSTHYYAEQKDDYYSRDGKSAVWQGAGAAALGLTGEVDPVRFKALLAGEFGQGIRTAGTVRRDARARAGVDLTFSAPKSVTLQALVAGDARVVAAHDEAVTEALAYIERELVMGRYKIDCEAFAEQTGNFIVAKFRHETARPTADARPDPQLHTHAIMMNLTQRKDGAWVSLSNEEIMRLQKLIDAHYMSSLAAGLEHLGYELRFEDNHVEIAQYTRPQIEGFSKRLLDINRALHLVGLDRRTASRGQKAVIALRTRQAKDQELSRDELREGWREHAIGLGIDLDGWKKSLGKEELEPSVDHGSESTVTPPGSEGLPPFDLGTRGDTSSDAPQPGAAREPDTVSYPTGGVGGIPPDAPQGLGEEPGNPSKPGGRAVITDEDATGLPTSTGSAGQDAPSGSDSHTADAVRSSPAEVGTDNRLGGSHGTDKKQAATGDMRTEARPNYVAIQAVRWAIKHLSEREAVMGESEILAAALRHAGGRANLASLQEELHATAARGTLLAGAQAFSPAEDLRSRPLTREAWIDTVMLAGQERAAAARIVTEAIIAARLVTAEQQYTTPTAHDREREILAQELAGRNTLEPIMTDRTIDTALADEPLLPGQREAATLILGTHNRIVGVQGLAGTGKSHMLDRTRRILERNGYKMVAVASYGSQVRALRALGVEASTIASRLEATNKRRFSDKIDAKTVLVVDEAGVVPSRLMIRLMDLAERTGARLVLLGDTGQTPAIEAGKPFAQMQRAGMATAVMGDIIRQKNPTLKAAVELAAAGKAKASLSRLEEVVEIKDEGERYQALAARYAEMPAAERAETLIVTGTNASRNAINEACHVERGLAGQGRDYTLLTRRDTTQAQRRYAKYYAVGDIIQPERDYACGLTRGALYSVMGVADSHQLKAQDLATGEVIDFLPSRTQKLSVYQPVTAELSAGDWVRVTRNDAELDLANGERFEVASVSESGVVLSAGTRTVSLPADVPLHLDRAYATTAHSAQGLTCDRVIINAESFSRTTKQDVYYVAISRARHAAVIYTNDQQALPAAVARREEKSAALDLVPKRKEKENDFRARHAKATPEMDLQ
ncbi:MobF family relaxase [Castellaniella sp. UC4442_H9]